MTNVEKLKEAGIIKEEHNLSQEQIDTINALAEEKVQAAIELKKEMGDQAGDAVPMYY